MQVLREIATNLHYRFIFSKNAQKGDLSFLANPKYRQRFRNTKPSLLFYMTTMSIAAPKIINCLSKRKIHLIALLRFVEKFTGKTFFLNLQSEFIQLLLFMKGAVIGDNRVPSGPFCYIGKGAQICGNTFIESKQSYWEKCKHRRALPILSGVKIAFPCSHWKWCHFECRCCYWF